MAFSTQLQTTFESFDYKDRVLRSETLKDYWLCEIDREDIIKWVKEHNYGYVVGGGVCILKICPEPVSKPNEYREFLIELNMCHKDDVRDGSTFKLLYELKKKENG